MAQEALSAAEFLAGTADTTRKDCEGEPVPREEGGELQRISLHRLA